MLLTLLLDPLYHYGEQYELTLSDIGLASVLMLLPLGLAWLTSRWAFRRLQQPHAKHKQQAQLALAAIALATAGYFFWFLNWLTS